MCADGFHPTGIQVEDCKGSCVKEIHHFDIVDLKSRSNHRYTQIRYRQSTSRHNHRYTSLYRRTKNRSNHNKKKYNMKYHVILGRFKWLINVSPSLEGIRYPRSVYVLSFVCFFLLLLLFLYSLEKQFGWFLTHISRLHI